MIIWQLQEAKSKFSQLVKQATLSGPQAVTLHGKPAVIVISVKDYEQLKDQSPSLVEFLKESPLQECDFETERNKTKPRDIEL